MESLKPKQFPQKRFLLFFENKQTNNAHIYVVTKEMVTKIAKALAQTKIFVPNFIPYRLYHTFTVKTNKFILNISSELEETAAKKST
jgi:hypothetical protein